MTEIVIDAEVIEDMTEAEAQRITARIGHMRNAVADAYGAYITLVTLAFDRRAWVALGYTSWDDYAAENLAVKVSRDDRMLIVGALTAAEMSTRSIGSLLGVSNKTIHQDQQKVLPPGNTSRTVIGPDNKKYSGTGKDIELSELNVPTAAFSTTRRAFDQAIRNADNALQRLERLVADDRFERNREALHSDYWRRVQILTDRVLEIDSALWTKPDTDEAIEIVTAAGDITNIEAFSRTSNQPGYSAVENQLDALLWQLARGDLSLGQVTPGVRGLVLFGYNEGRMSLQPTVDRLNAECDRLYLRAHNSPEQILAIQRRQMDAAAAQYWDDVMSGRIELTDTTRTAA